MELECFDIAEEEQTRMIGLELFSLRCGVWLGGSVTNLSAVIAAT